MQDPSLPSDGVTPQFESVEYKQQSPSDKCAFCHSPIIGQYYRVNGAVSCGSCANAASRHAPPISHAAYVRALLFGVGAAVVGLVPYAAFGIMTGWVIGYLSLGVGFIIGWAMLKGSRGVGGRKYQITAALLTYAAVSLAAIPIAIADQSKQQQEHPQQQVESRSKRESPASSASSSADPQSPAAPVADAESASPESKHSMGLGAALAYLAMLGLASPFLDLQDPIHGMIGLVILIIGIRIAWRMTAGGPGVTIEGPYGMTANP